MRRESSGSPVVQDRSSQTYLGLPNKTALPFQVRTQFLSRRLPSLCVSTLVSGASLVNPAPLGL